MVTQKIKQKQRVMVVYNNLDALELLNDSLKTDGFDIVITVDEDEAAHALETLSPDMVIMDTVTADAHSLHLLDILKTKTKAPVIVITPDNDIITLKKMFDHGADDLVYQPLNTRVFIARVHAMLRRWYNLRKSIWFHPNIKN